MSVAQKQAIAKHLVTMNDREDPGTVQRILLEQNLLGMMDRIHLEGFCFSPFKDDGKLCIACCYKQRKPDGTVTGATYLFGLPEDVPDADEFLLALGAHMAEAQAQRLGLPENQMRVAFIASDHSATN